MMAVMIFVSLALKVETSLFGVDGEELSAMAVDSELVIMFGWRMEVLGKIYELRGCRGCLFESIEGQEGKIILQVFIM